MTRGAAGYALGAAAAGLLLVMAGTLLQPRAIPHAVLSVLVLFCAWPVGCLLLLFAHALTGGRWGSAVRPGLRAGLVSLFAVPVLAVPVALMLPGLYPWARAEGAALPNHAWLNLPFFAGRAAVYLLCWLGLGLLAARSRHVAGWAPAALIALALSWTFASIDLVLSLEPHFTSSVFGMLSLAGAAVLALSLAVLLSPDPGRDRSNDLGKLLLGLAVLWAYLDFMQLLIVWQSDLVKQVPWYAARSFGGPGIVAGAVALGHTVVPFFVLLSSRLRRSVAVLRAVAALMVGSEVLRTWWLVLPASDRRFGALDLGCLLLAGGLVTFAALRRAAREGTVHD